MCRCVSGVLYLNRLSNRSFAIDFEYVLKNGITENLPDCLEILHGKSKCHGTKSYESINESIA